MKRFFLFSLFVQLSTALIFAQSPSIGGFNVYYGHLHNHSNLTDGQGSPEHAYQYAKNNAGLDFFSLGDHAETLTANEYKRMKEAANAANEDGVYTTFWGFEWSGVTHGHVLVVNADDYCTSLQSATTSFGKLIDWLSVRECVAFFNHPGRHDVVGNEFLHFNYKPIDQMVGMELWNKNDAFSRYYYNNGYYGNDENRGYFDEAIARGWKIGASGSDDNHGGNWGTRNDYRMAILSTKLTRNDLYEAMKARRFYSTLDKNLALSFKIDGNEMGSTILGGDAKINISAFDKNGEKFTHVVLFKNGIQEKTWNINTANVNITYNTKTFDNDYFYVKVTQNDGDEAISSPVWIEGGLEPQTLKVRVNKGSDDAEEGPRGKMYINSSDLELVYDVVNGGNQKVGIRFEHNKIPQDALITNAYIQFTVDELSVNSSKMTINGHKSTNSKTFEKVKHNVSSRTKTNASVTWKPGNWYRVGKTSDYQRTPNIKNIVQEIVNQPDFKTSSALTFIFTGKGRRTAESFEGWKEKAPQLVVEYLAVKSADSEMKQFDMISKTEQEINNLELSQWDYKIAPNPAQNNVIILYLNNCKQPLQMKLFNTSGHCVMRETVQGDMAVLSHQLAKGLYILQLSDNKTISRQKLIIK